MSLTLAAEPDYDSDPHLWGHRSFHESNMAVLLSLINPLNDATESVYRGEKSGGMKGVGLHQYWPRDTHGMEVGFHSTYR